MIVLQKAVRKRVNNVVVSGWRSEAKERQRACWGAGLGV